MLNKILLPEILDPGVKFRILPIKFQLVMLVIVINKVIIKKYFVKPILY